MENAEPLDLEKLIVDPREWRECYIQYRLYESDCHERIYIYTTTED